MASVYFPVDIGEARLAGVLGGQAEPHLNLHPAVEHVELGWKSPVFPA